MDIQYELRGIRFRWNAEKAKRYIAKHGVSFEQGAEVFLIRFFDMRKRHERESIETRRLVAISTFTYSTWFI